MKKVSRRKSDGELRAEYDFSGGIRGKHAKRYAEGTNIIRLDPQVSEFFHNDERSVNQFLRSVIQVLKHKSA